MPSFYELPIFLHHIRMPLPYRPPLRDQRRQSNRTAMSSYSRVIYAYESPGTALLVATSALPPPRLPLEPPLRMFQSAGSPAAGGASSSQRAPSSGRLAGRLARRGCRLVAARGLTIRWCHASRTDLSPGTVRTARSPVISVGASQQA